MATTKRRERMRVYVSPGNTKLGKVLNVSLPPVLTCGKDVPCSKDCYALKAWKQYPATRFAWRGNYDAFKRSPDDYFDALVASFKKSKVALVRWGVSGDIVDATYLAGIIRVAKELPKKRFLVYTKRYDLVDPTAALPGNLTIVVSAWPGYALPEHVMKGFGVAWMRDPDNPDARIPTTAKACNGGCEKCALCWSLRAGQSVVFDKH